MATIQYLIRAVDDASATFAKISTSADGLNGQLDELGKKSVAARVGLDGDVKMERTLQDLDLKLARLNLRTTKPKLNDDQIVRASIQAAALNLQLDKLNDKKVKLHVADAGGGIGRVITGLLGGFAGGGGKGGAGAVASAGASAGGAGASAVSGILGTPVLGPVTIASAAAAGLTALLIGAGGIVPALAAATGGVAAFGALALPTFTQLIAKSAQLTAVKTVFGSMVAALRPDVVKLFNTAMKTLVGLLPQLLPFAHVTAVALGGLLKGFGQFATSKGFGLFLNSMLKLTGPTITVIGKGLGQIAIAIGKLLLALVNPNSLKILRVLLEGVAGVITGLAATINVVTPFMIHAFHSWASTFDTQRRAFAVSGHAIAVVFDVVRHAVAVFGSFFGQMMTQTGHVFSRGVQYAEDWHTLVDRAIDGVVAWFKGMPARVLGALRGFGTTLWNLGKTWLTDLWNGIKSVSGGILSWFGGFLSKILGFLGKLTGHSPSGEFYFAGQKMMTQLAAGIKSRAHVAANAAQAAAQRVAIPSGLSGSVAQWISRALAITHSPPSWLGILERLVSFESGGNPRAYNPSGASGLFQTIPSTFAAYSLGGSIWNPIADAIAGIRYLRATYGTPYNIPGLVSGNYHGYALGGVIREPILGFGRSGRMYGFGERGPETVTPGTSGSGRGVTINNNFGPGSISQDVDPVLLGQRMSFQITAATFGS